MRFFPIVWDTIGAAAAAAVVAIAASLLAACCGPAQCPQAKNGIAVLDKAVKEVEQYKDRNGRYPVVLDDVKKGYGAQVEAELKADCPDCRAFQYKTDSFGYEMEYLYDHFGKNRCAYGNETEKWDCQAIY